MLPDECVLVRCVREYALINDWKINRRSSQVDEAVTDISHRRINQPALDVGLKERSTCPLSGAYCGMGYLPL